MFDRAPILFMRVADENHAAHFETRGPQRREREQRVIDRAKRAARGN